MELEYTSTNGRMTTKIDGRGVKDLFKNLAEFCEIFEHVCTVKTADGKVHSSDKVIPRVREVDGNEYYELVCIDENPILKNRTLQFGQHKQGGTLFPKRGEEVEENGKKIKKWYPNGGWGRFDAKSGETKYE